MGVRCHTVVICTVSVSAALSVSRRVEWNLLGRMSLHWHLRSNVGVVLVGSLLGWRRPMLGARTLLRGRRAMKQHHRWRAMTSCVVRTRESTWNMGLCQLS